MDEKIIYKGVAASKGIGIGKVYVIKEQELIFEDKSKDGAEEEKKRLERAIAAFKDETLAMSRDVKNRIGEKEAEIIEAHFMMAQDPELEKVMIELIEDGNGAEAAVSNACDIFTEVIEKGEDEDARQRISDIMDVKSGILRKLLGIKGIDPKDLEKDTILVAKELTPSFTAALKKENVLAIVTESGGLNSHAAILARALGIPAVLSVPGITGLVKDGDLVIADGIEGNVYVSPDEETISKYKAAEEQSEKEKAAREEFRGKETLTKDGLKMEIFCNIGGLDDAVKAIEADCEGIGLFRTEYLYMESDKMPSEEAQFNAYKDVLDKVKKPVIIRTLDMGGDKVVSYLNMKKEDNPFLGYRAVRYCLGNRDVLKTQLRAIMCASVHGNIKIMLPLVTCVEEVREAKKILEEVKRDLKNENILFKDNVQIGCMAETAASAIIADLLAKEVDFFSIGTNDLIQYVMSVDRGNADVAYLYSLFHPSVLRAIQAISNAGKRAGIPVEMCGEAAAEVAILPLLISFGIKAISVNPAHVLEMREAISKWTKAEADAVTKLVMTLDNASDIEELLKKAEK